MAVISFIKLEIWNTLNFKFICLWKKEQKARQSSLRNETVLFSSFELWFKHNSTAVLENGCLSGTFPISVLARFFLLVFLNRFLEKIMMVYMLLYLKRFLISELISFFWNFNNSFMKSRRHKCSFIWTNMFSCCRSKFT